MQSFTERKLINLSGHLCETSVHLCEPESAQFGNALAANAVRERRLMAKPLAYRAFLLTAWEERRQTADVDPVWRFGLEDVRGLNRRRVFTTLEEVMRYVKAELAAPSTTDLAAEDDVSASASSSAC